MIVASSQESRPPCKRDQLVVLWTKAMRAWPGLELLTEIERAGKRPNRAGSFLLRSKNKSPPRKAGGTAVEPPPTGRGGSYLATARLKLPLVSVAPPATQKWVGSATA